MTASTASTAAAAAPLLGLPRVDDRSVTQRVRVVGRHVSDDGFVLEDHKGETARVVRFSVVDHLAGFDGSKLLEVIFHSFLVRISRSTHKDLATIFITHFVGISFN